jgi:bacterioferritin
MANLGAIATACLPGRLQCACPSSRDGEWLTRASQLRNGLQARRRFARQCAEARVVRLGTVYAYSVQKENDMKASAKLLTVLNELLADELSAISQSILHGEMCEDWGYGRLHHALKHQAKDEMHHAKWLIRRILFLEGVPVMSKVNPIKIGKTVPDMMTQSQDGEQAAVAAYNQAIGLAQEVGDNATADLLLRILKMEESHMEWAERQRGQIDQMGLQNYLARQTKGAAA